MDDIEECGGHPVKRHIEEDKKEEPVNAKRFKPDSEEDDVYRAGILDLPNEILIKLFRYLDSTDIISLDLTCKRFANIATTSSLWKDFDLYNSSLDYKQYTDYLMRAHSGTWRVRIDCGDSLREFTTPCFMKWLKSTCPSLTVLHLHNQMIDTRQMKLETFPLTLKELSLMNVKAYSSRVLPSEFFRNIDKLFVNLETLVLSGCDWFNPHCILVVSKLPKLKHLNLYKCKTSNSMPYFSLATRLGFPKLETIDLRQTGIGDSEVACFNSVKTLRCLYLEARRPEHYEEKVIPETPPSKQCSFCGKHTLRYNKEESTYRYTIEGVNRHRIPTSSGQAPPEVTHIFPADERTPFAHSLIHSNYIENIIDFNNERAFNLHNLRYETDPEDLSRPSNQDQAPRPPLHITIPKSNINIIFPENKWGVTRSSNSDPRTNVTINGRAVEPEPARGTDNQSVRTDDDTAKKSDSQSAGPDSESDGIETSDNQNGERVVKSDLLKKIDNHCVNVDKAQHITNKDGGKRRADERYSDGKSSFEIGVRCNNSNSNSDSEGESNFEIGLRYKNSTKNSGLATNKCNTDNKSASPVPGCSYSKSNDSKDGGKRRADESEVHSDGESSFEIGVRCNNSNSNSDSDGESNFEIGLRYINRNSGLETNKCNTDNRSASPVPGCSYSKSNDSRSKSPVAGCSYSRSAAANRHKRVRFEGGANDPNKPTNETPLLKVVKNFFEKDGSQPSTSSQNREEKAQPSPDADSVRDNNNEPEADNSGSVVISVRFSETGPRWTPLRPLARVTWYPLQSPEGTINNNTIISLFYNTSCVNLERLSLTGYTDINDRSLESIATSDILLRYLDVRRTSVTLDGCAKFKMLRPDCEIICDFEINNC